ncbi:sirohydrochlorin chelatase [Kurthia senegalensis]|uniref:sirohydrochlorin chelatase n=1 Tax=Kurthia senegalensis TaxID=1033740 RepID=UPI000287C0E5|nr:sirohydrochlorin chelatase [Kurthia senegalensis]
MQAIIYVAHGTRIQEGNKEAEAFVQRAIKRVDCSIQKIAFLEIAKPSIEQIVAECVREGVTNIVIVPLLLFKAQHLKEDIPSIIGTCQKVYPHVTFTIGREFGIDRRLITQVNERLTESGENVTSHSEILLIGRGSSDEAAIKAFREVATRLKLYYGFRKVYVRFLYGNGPKFEDFFEEQHEQVFVVPYLLFQGRLRNHIEQTIAQNKEHNMVVCNSLGYSDKVLEVLVERTQCAQSRALNRQNEVANYGISS